MSSNYRFEAVDRDLWSVTYPDLMLGIGTRMTIVRLGGGGLFIHSPSPLDDTLKAELANLGPVRAIVAPNNFHHLFLSDFAATYPDVPVFATAGVQKKQPKARIDEILGERPSELWASDLEQIAIEGMAKINEVVFFHRASSSLILTDLVFNIPRDVPLFARLFSRLAGTYGRVAVSRLLKRFMINDRDQFLASVEKLYSRPFTRILVTHREIYKGGPEELRKVFEKF